ncbi:MAG: hypothetical protein ABJB74_06345 [Gemmatimonas sp.]
MCLFLVVVSIAAARSYGMIMSLVVMLFMGKSKAAPDASMSESNDQTKTE